MHKWLDILTAQQKLEKILDQIEGHINEMVQDIEEVSKESTKEDSNSSKDKQDKNKSN